jgi:hypothetical protein
MHMDGEWGVVLKDGLERVKEWHYLGVPLEILYFGMYSYLVLLSFRIISLIAVFSRVACISAICTVGPP